MPHETEIGAKLVLDDLASETLHHVKEGFEHVKEKAVETGHELVNMAKQAAAFALGFQLNASIESVKEFGEEILHAARNQENERRELASLIAMTDKSGASFDELADRAREVDEAFERTSVSAGVSKDAMLDAFEMIASRAPAAEDAEGKLAEMTEKMATASKGLNGGLGALSAGWRDMEAGIVRPKNALVQFMRQTGVVEGSSKKVAKALSAMLQSGDESKKDQVFALAERAIDRMAAKMKDMPLTFDQLMESLHGLREQFQETMGVPILHAIGPYFEKLQHYLVEHREEIEKLAATLGERVGEWVGKAAKMIQEGFDYLQTHADEILDALEKGGKAIKSAVAFIVEHRTLLTGLALAYAVRSPAAGIAGAVAQAAPAVGAGLGNFVGTMGGLSGTSGLPAVLALSTGLATAATTAVAAGSWYLAYQQSTKLENETGLSMMQILDHLGGGLDEIFGSADNMLNFNATLKAMDENFDKVNTSSDAIEHYIHQLERSGEAAVEAGDMTADAYNKVLAHARQQAEEHQKAVDAFERFQDAAASTMGGGFAPGLAMMNVAGAYHDASEINAKEAEAAARRILTANEALRVALAGAAGSVEDALKRLKGLASGKAEDGVKLPPVNLNFGPTTIHQDFRSADPDRIAVLFRKDLQKQATSRVASRTGTPFGF